MTTKDYSLQLLHHKEVFATRELAKQYINEEFKNKSLIAEPAIVFYGDPTNPNLIMAIGSADRRVFFIDTALLEEQIENTMNETDDNTLKIEGVSKALKEVVEQVGLVWDENKKSNQITYEPDSHDELIGNAVNLAEAIAVISQFVQEQFKVNNLSVKDSDTVILSFAPAANGGKELTATVRISEYGAEDQLKFNDNIVGVKNDGIYAAANLAYEEDTHRLIFTTSGVRNGRFVDDANIQIVELGEHTQYTPDNTDHTVKLVVDAERNTISADVKISDSSKNILVAQDGKLLVDGRASNIAYKDGTVFSGLNKIEHDIEGIENEIQRINDTHFVDGDETDTMVITTTKQPLGNYKVSGEVRLGDNKSIKVIEGGLEVDLDITSDLAANQLIVRLGGTEKVVNLPGIQLLSDVRYDSSNRSIVISTTDGKIFTIPVGDLISTWIVDNGVNNPIVLTKTTSTTSAPDTLTAELKISTKGGNILSVDEQGRLLADSTTLNTKIENEILRAQAAERVNADAITDHVVEVNQKVADIAETTANVKAELVDGIDAVDDKVIALTERLTNDETNISNLTTRADGFDTQCSDINADLANTKTNLELAKALADNNKVEIDGLKTKTDAIQTKVSDIERDIEVHDANYNALKTTVDKNVVDIAAIKDGLNAETARATDAEGILRSDLDITKGEVVRVENKLDHIVNADIENRLSTLEDAIGDGVAETLASAKEYTDAEVAKHIVDTNNAIVNAKRDTLDDAKAYADEKSANALADAKVYADDEKTRAKAAEEANTAAINALQARDIQLTSAIAEKVSTVEIVKNSTSDLQYILKVDGRDAGEINIPKDQFLKSASYNEVSKELSFIFVTSEGEETVTFSIANLVDTYLAGDGIKLEGNKFGVKLCGEGESYLTVTADGILLKGLDEKFLTKADKDNVYTKSEADTTFIKEHQSLAHLATKVELNDVKDIVDAVSDKADANESALVVVNGNEAQEGSIKKALKDAKDYADEIVGELSSNVATKADASVVDELVGKVEIINGNEAQEGSIKKAIADTEAYTDTKISAVSAVVATKADADVVDGLIDNIAIINGNEATEGSIAKALKDAKDYTDDKVGELSAVVGTKADASVVDELVGKVEIINGNEAQEGSIKKSLKDAKDYVDDKVGELSAVVGTKADADIVYTKDEIDAKGYLIDADIANFVDKTEYDAKVAEIDTELSHKIESVKIVKNSMSDLQYVLKVNDIDVSEINIPKDQFLKTVSYNEGNKTLDFVFVTTDEEKTVNVNIADLVDTYEAGKGLKLTGNAFSIKLCGESESYLTVTDDGLVLKGLDEKFDTKANVADLTPLATKDEVNAVKTYADGIADRVTANENALNIINGNSATEGSIQKAIADTQTYTDGKFDALSAVVGTKADATDLAVINAKVEIINGNESTEGSISKTLKDAKEYTDTKIDEVNTVVVTKANSTDLAQIADKVATIQGGIDVEGSIKKAVADAETYTDSKITEVNTVIATKANTVDVYTKTEIDNKGYLVSENIANFVDNTTLNTKVGELEASDLAINAEIERKFGTVKIEQNPASELQYILYVDGVNAGAIDIPKDQFLSHVRYSAGEKAIYFTFETSTGTQEVPVDVTDLVDTYEAGNGLSLTGNTFAIKLCGESESYLTVTDDGLVLKGLDEKFDAKANVTDLAPLATKTEVDAIKTYADGIVDRVADNENALTIINGNEAQEGSIAKSLKDAKDYTNDKVGEVNAVIDTKADASVVTELAGKVDVINGNEATEGSIKKGVADAKSYTDNKIVGVNAVIDTKANSTDLAQIADKVATIQGGIDVEGSIKKAVADAEAYTDSKIVDVNAVIATKANAVDVYTKTEIDNKGYLTEHQDISMLANQSSVDAINNKLGNIKLTYDNATNKLTFNDGNGDIVITLSEASLVQNVYYDGATNEIVFVTDKGTWSIPASSIVTLIDVENPDNSPISLKKTRRDGKDYISADLIISEQPGNLLRVNERSLYVSAKAEDHIAHWIDEDISVQAAIERLRDKFNLIAGLEEDVNILTDKVLACEQKVNDYEEVINALTQQFNELKTFVEAWGDDIDELKRQHNDDEDPTTFASRMNHVEDEVENMVDFNDGNEEW